MIRLEAGEHAPRLVSLRRRGAAPWVNADEETLPASLWAHGILQPLVWRLDRGSSRFQPREVQLVYFADAPEPPATRPIAARPIATRPRAARLKLEWGWRARSAHGPLEHTLLIQNLSSEAVELPLRPGFRFNWRLPAESALERFWVEKGADTPSAEGTHLDAMREGDAWSGYSSTYARPRPNRAREMIPFLLVEETGGARRGWYAGIESSARTRISVERRGDSLRGEAGLDAGGDEKTRLPPGGIFEAPVIFMGSAQNGPDGAGNELKRWVRAALGNPRVQADPAYPLMVSNSWGSGMAVNDALARRMITDSAQLGLEMFHLDAGWFRDVGDWRADPGKFPEGIAGVADFAHRHGLKFGLWMDWTQAGSSRSAGALNVDDPTTRAWLIADPPAGWQHREPFKGITLDLGVPAVQAWAARELERVVSEYRLDMLEHDGYLVAQGSSHTDHAATAPDPATLRVYEDSGFLWADGSNAADVSYHATRAYYELYRQLRAHHPALLLEVCNDGGRMVDFGSAAHGDYFSITDTYDPLSNRRAFYDASYLLPPAMLESYVAQWPAARIENFRYQLRSGMLGWFSLMLDTSQWSPAQRDEARQEFKLYKSALRPLIREAELYHVEQRPDGVHWDGIEYFSARLKRGVLYAFRGAVADEPSHRYRLQGLDPKKSYRLTFHDSGAAAGQMHTGQVLMQTGVAVALPQPLSSELIFIEETP